MHGGALERSLGQVHEARLPFRGDFETGTRFAAREAASANQ